MSKDLHHHKRQNSSNIDEETQREKEPLLPSSRARRWLHLLFPWCGGDTHEEEEGGSHTLLIWTVVGVITGMIVGYIVNKHNPGETAMELLSFPGEILLNMLRALVLPLVTASVIVGIGALGEAGSTGRLAVWTLIYFGATTLFAAAMGIFWVLLIQPGDFGDVKGGDAPDVEEKTPLESILEVIRSAFPPNLFAAAHDMNVLGVLTFAIALGIVISMLGEVARPLALFFNALNEAIMKIVSYVILLVPIGVCSLIIDKLGGSGEDFFGQLEQLSMYAVTVIVGLIFHSFIFLPLIYFIIVRSNPFTFMWKTSQALLIAVGTSSSAATLPVTIKVCEENCNIKPHITRFILPLGATVNMNGTALYEAVAALFVAQSLDIELSVGQVIVTALTATLAAVGAAGIPEAGLVTMVMVFSAIGLPLESIGILFSIDWFLDRLRTGTNVIGDTYGAAIIAHLDKKRNAQATPFPDGDEENTLPVTTPTMTSKDMAMDDADLSVESSSYRNASTPSSRRASSQFS
eukprot:TRINITY_DN2975_c0_g1_i1.p1 TRINITY_DN2975_c0_g1~~TRINITY_DN2975_c0_g1_i1.p1  ORF type:complete len:519 (-),score=91.76 TRINITY_DN2975_c0_g1_i1:13-1569(-)